MPAVYKAKGFRSLFAPSASSSSEANRTNNVSVTGFGKCTYADGSGDRGNNNTALTYSLWGNVPISTSTEYNPIMFE